MTEDDWEARIDNLLSEVTTLSKRADAAINAAALEDAWWKKTLGQAKKNRIVNR